MPTAERELVRRDLAEAASELEDQPRSHKELIEEFQAVAVRSAVDEAKEAETLDELRQWTEASSSMLRLLRHNRSRLFARLLEVLNEVSEDDDLAPEALEEWGRLQALATYDRLRSDSYSIRWLEDHDRSRQQINAWKKRGRLFSIAELPGVKGHAYPRWQFDSRLRPKPWVADIVNAAQEANYDPVALHLFMTSPTAVPTWAQGETNPVELADAGDVDEVVKLVRAGNAQSG
jgi:hypothetical protein